MTTSSFGETIRTRRLDLELTLGELSKATGVSVPYLSEIENGGRKPFPIGKDDTYAKLAKALKLNQKKLEQHAMLERQEFPDEVAKQEDLREVALALYRRSSQPGIAKLSPTQLAEIKRLLGD